MQSKKSLVNNAAVFSFGELGLQFGWTFLGTYLSVFYTDIVGLAPLAVTVLMLVARIWDAVNDPMMGMLAERTRSRWGRFRPYIGFASPVLGIFIILCFTNPFAGGSGSARMAWACVTYIIAGMLYTMVSIPYGAMPGVVTEDADKRNKLNAARAIGQNGGMIIINAFSAGIMLFFSGGGSVPNLNGYFSTAVAYSVLMIFMMLFCFALTKEHIIPARTKTHVPILTTLKTVVRNKYLMIVFLMKALYMTGFMGRISVMAFYCTYCLNNFEVIALLMTIPNVISLLISLAVPALSRRLGKRNVFALGAFFQGVSLLGVFFIPFQNIQLIVAAHIVFGIFGTIFAPSLSMVADAVDYEELRSGVRTDGTAYATYTLAVKLGNALGGGLFLLVIDLFGYVPNTVQTPTAMFGINLVVNLIPGILLMLSALVCMMWRMTDQQADEIRLQLKQRGAAGQ